MGRPVLFRYLQIDCLYGRKTNNFYFFCIINVWSLVYNSNLFKKFNTWKTLNKVDPNHHEKNN